MSESMRTGTAINDREGAMLARAVDALRRGEVVVYPTETFYALGVDFSIPGALDRLFALKVRQLDSPVALIAADTAMAFSIAREVPPAARALAEKFWPGPLTLVLPAHPGIPAGLIGPDGGVGVRVSPHPLCRALTSALGRPLTATSANRSGEPPARSIDEARTYFGRRVAVYLDGGAATAISASTVVGFDGTRVRIIRKGAIAADALTEYLK
jgi:L-threonylcarbamoyladenylate synthase